MNIAEILKCCPKGTKLYSTIFGNVEFQKVLDEGIIEVTLSCGAIERFFKDGLYTDDGECVLFPSKDQRDWSKFRLPFKAGDIVMTIDKLTPFIFKEYIDDVYAHCYCGVDVYDTLKIEAPINVYWTSSFIIPASKEAKKELFDKMTEAGYRWNADALELEKIEPKFKEGDVVIDKNNNLHLVSSIDSGFIYAEITLYANGKLDINNNPTGYFNSTITLASKEEKNKLLSFLVREGYKYDKEQHKLIKREFKPYDKVLVRDDVKDFWKTDIYLSYVEKGCYHYRCTTGHYRLCIPYEGNEYLLGTTDSPT